MLEAVVVAMAGSEVTVMDTMDIMKVIMAGSMDAIMDTNMDTMVGSVDIDTMSES